MFDPGTALAAALAGSGAPAARLVVLDGPYGADLRSWAHDGGILEAGAVEHDRARGVRRSGGFTVSNVDGALSPKVPGDPFFPGTWVRLDRGAVVAGRPSYLPLLTGVVTGFGAAMAGHLSVRVEDPTTLLAAPFGEVVVIPAGTPAESAVRTLWAPVLDPVGGGAGWPLDGASRTTPLRVFMETDDRLASVLEMLGSLGLEAFADRLGRPVLRPVPDPTAPGAVGAVRGFVPGETSTLLGLERTGDRRPHNRVIVESVPTDGSDVVRAVMEVTDPSSAIHRDRIGVQTAPVHRSPGITDQATANAVARALLVELGLYADRVSGSAAPDPTLDEDDVVTIEEPVSGTVASWRLDRVTHPLLEGGMGIEATRVLPLLLADA